MPFWATINVCIRFFFLAFNPELYLTDACDWIKAVNQSIDRGSCRQASEMTDTSVHITARTRKRVRKKKRALFLAKWSSDSANAEFWRSAATHSWGLERKAGVNSSGGEKKKKTLKGASTLNKNRGKWKADKVVFCSRLKADRLSSSLLNTLQEANLPWMKLTVFFPPFFLAWWSLYAECMPVEPLCVVVAC